MTVSSLLPLRANEWALDLVWYNSIFWIAWIVYWSINAPANLIAEEKKTRSPLLNVYVASIAMLIGWGLNEHGKKWKRKVNVGLLGFLGIPLILWALDNLFFAFIGY